MQTTRYLIVGGGMTADAAAKGIREHDADGTIAIVAAEPHPPYARPPLTKGLWKGGDEAKIWRGTDALAGLDLRTGRRIASLDLDGHRAVDDRGEEYGYEKLLLATGSRPRELAGSEGVVYFRTYDDYRSLRATAKEGAHVVVIGGGFIGSEIAAALVGAGCRVTMVFPEPSIGWRLFPPDLAAFVTDYYREKGIDVLADQSVKNVAGGRVELGSGQVLEAEMVVAGLGVEPQTELAAAAGLPIDNGIVVDDRGRVGGRGDVFAAGDVASFPAVGLGRNLRVEHENHATSHGRLVGANMAGADDPYDYLPFFYSDLFDLGYEAVGEVDSRLTQLAGWAEPNRKGVVAYVDDASRPRGFLLWNTWDRVDAARDLILAKQPIDAAMLEQL
jgi:3-phenylpropionate/trans-cinnamate dioxygenase ferredoxin reductase component